MNLLWPIIRSALSHPRRVAVEDDRRRYIYGQILGGAMFMAQQIDSATAAPHVGILLPTSGAFPIALLGCWLARRVGVPLNYLLTRDDLAYIIADSDVDTVITVKPMLDFLGGPAILPPGVKALMLEDVDFHGLPPLRWPPIPGGDDLAVLLYTSGTSARPKGVMLTHGNLASNATAGIRHSGITSADSFLGVLPQFHSFGLTALTLIPLLVGAKVVYTARFVPKQIIELLRKHRPQIIMFVPSMYGALLSVKDAGPDDFTSIIFAVSGGEALPDAIADEYQQRFKLRLLEGYGLTETAPVLTWSTPRLCKMHSVGPPLPGVSVVIVDEQGRPRGANQDGEILVAGPNIMKGYYKLPEATRKVFVEMDAAPGLDPLSPIRGRERAGVRAYSANSAPFGETGVNPGTPSPGGDDAATLSRGERGPEADAPRRLRFFRTGDIGRLDEDGFLHITGRIKEMLKVGGEIVFPREIEEVLNQHPSVRASAVIGKADGMRGEVPVAFVEINPDQPPDQAFDETALRHWCRQRLAGFKVPREIRRLDQLPRNPTGKVLKRELRAE